MKHFIGVDVGGTKIAIVSGDENGNVLKKVRFENDAPVQTVLERIVTEVKKMGAADAIGISCGGPLDSKRGLILSPPNLPGWDEIPIVTRLKEATGIPAFLQNDADACALAEWKYGAGRGSDSMIFLTFGTGLGAGLILDGRLYAGSSGSAGEVGHIAMEKDGPIGYGKRGSLEGFCSGGGIRQLAQASAKKRLAMGERVSYCKSEEELSQITAKTVADCAFAGHEDAKEIYTECGTMLGRGLAILVDLLNPQKIVIGSIYARARELLEEAMTESLRREALPHALFNCEILPAALGESLGDIAALAVAQNGLEKGNTYE